MVVIRRLTFMLAACAALAGEANGVPLRWSLADGGMRIVWNVREDKRLPHRDMLEMSGLQASLVLSYEIDAARKPEGFSPMRLRNVLMGNKTVTLTLTENGVEVEPVAR